VRAGGILLELDFGTFKDLHVREVGLELLELANERTSERAKRKRE